MLARSAPLLLVSLTIATPAVATPHRYTMPDLQALATATRWSELLEHVEDIPPAKRDAAWQALLRKAATGWLSQPAIAANALRAAQIAEALLRRHPSLAKDKGLMKRRNAVGLEAFARCFAQRYWVATCERHLRRFVAQRGTDGATAQAAAELVRRHMAHHRAAPYFRRAVSGEAAGKKEDVARRCGDAGLAQAVLSALTHPLATPAEVAAAKEAALGPCWPQLRAKLVDAVAASERGQKVLCHELLARKALAGVRRKKCSRLVQP